MINIQFTNFPIFSICVYIDKVDILFDIFYQETVKVFKGTYVSIVSVLVSKIVDTVTYLKLNFSIHKATVYFFIQTVITEFLSILKQFMIST